MSLPPGFHTADITPEMLDRLPEAVHHGLVLGYAQTIQTVFEVSVPICALAFLASFLIPHVELRRWPERHYGGNARPRPAPVEGGGPAVASGQ